MSIFNKIEAEMPGYLDEFTDLKLDIAEAIDAHLRSKGMSQKDLAQAIGKSEAEVSKWLSGLHNLTLRSIAKMQYALGERVISVHIPEVTKDNYQYTHVALGPKVVKMVKSRKANPISESELTIVKPLAI